jgi:hypothetical protein
LLVGIAAWAGLAYAALRVAELPGEDLTHGLCGPWGCLPPAQALAAMHLFWAVALAGPTAWLVRRWPARRLRAAGAVVAAVAATALVALLACDAALWLQGVPPDLRRHLPQRALYHLATQTDLPLPQLLLGGAALLAAGRWKARPRPAASTSPTPALPPAGASRAIPGPAPERSYP